MKILSRQDAIKNKLNRYFTGEPCGRGHVCERIVSSCNCIECLKKYRSTNDYKINYNKRRKILYDKYKPAARSYQKNWIIKNKERLAIKRRKHYLDNKEKDRILQKIYREKNPELISELKRNYRSKKSGAAGRHSHEDVAIILKSQNNKCVGCNTNISYNPKESEEKLHVDHKMPLSRGGTNWPWNIQCLCWRCNLSKTDLTYDEWAERLNLKHTWRVSKGI